MEALKLYGWTLKQWANATAVLNRQPATLLEACELLKDWQNSDESDPSVIEIIGDYKTARNLFWLLDEKLNEIASIGVGLFVPDLDFRAGQAWKP